MRLEEYWGIGPKTSSRLREELGQEQAIKAIENADIRTLTQAGLSRGRVTRILRHTNNSEGLDILATKDTREIYKSILDIACSFAVTDQASDRIRVLTPLQNISAMQNRLDRVMDAAATLNDLSADEKEQIMEAFDKYERQEDNTQASIKTALSLYEIGVMQGPFSPLSELDIDALTEAYEALQYLQNDHVQEGADDRLDGLRNRLSEIKAIDQNTNQVLEAVQSETIRGTDEFREAFLQYLLQETSLSHDQIQTQMPADARDSEDFISSTLRNIITDLENEIGDREEDIKVDLEWQIEQAREDIDRCVEVIDEIALDLSLGRFTNAYELTRPTIRQDTDTVAVKGARHLGLSAMSDTQVQPISYAIGDHSLPSETPPSGQQVAVLTGANSGGKTTLLETLCQIALMTQMGLPVPADTAEISIVDAVVFHRRHASFNAGVLESTLRTIIPPLSTDGKTLMLVDEFEAITEPGSAADLLHGLVQLTNDNDDIGVFVTHLADDLKPLPESARIDGIFAEGLNSDLELEVDYQPQFFTLGKSTPEFIVSRLLANASTPAERMGFEALAEAIGEATIQRTLADTRWNQ